MLGEERFDLEDACPCPVLEPGLAEVVLDLVKAAFTHGAKYRHGCRTTPWAERLICGLVSPTTLGRSLAAFLLINPRSGKGSPTADELAAEARALGVDDSRPAGRRGPRRARPLPRTAEVLGMAGGDGSLAPVAEVALERDLPFVCIPFGTRNHFARDLGLDRDDPIGALRAFGGPERRIDVGRADERLFLNNVSLGVYARLVHRREAPSPAPRRLCAGPRVGDPAHAPASARHHDRRRTGRDAGSCSSRTTRTTLELPSLGERERLDEGKLHLYTPGRRSAGARRRALRHRLQRRTRSRRRSTASPSAARRRSSSRSSRARYACSSRRPRAADSTAG